MSSEYDLGKRHLCYVYGTLRTGFGNNRLLRTSKLLGKHTTEPAFSMFSYGAFPYVSQGGKTAIQGEVWEVNGETLYSLDCLEGHPNFYERKQVIPTEWGDAWVYLIEGRDNSPPVESGDWAEYVGKS